MIARDSQSRATAVSSRAAAPHLHASKSTEKAQRPQPAQHAHGVQHGRGGAAQVSERLVNYADHRDDAVQPVPRVAQVRALVRNQAVGDHLQHRLRSKNALRIHARGVQRRRVCRRRGAG